MRKKNKKNEKVGFKISQQDRFEVLLEDMSGQIKAVAEGQDSLRGEMNRRFDEIDERFEQVDRKFEQVDRRFDEVDERFKEVHENFRTVFKHFDIIDDDAKIVNKRLTSIEEHTQRMDKKLGSIEEELKEVRVELRKKADKKDIEGVKETTKRIEKLEQKMEFFEKAKVAFQN